MTQPERGAVLTEGPSISGAVIGEDALHADPPSVEERDRRGYEGAGVDVAAARTQLNEGQATCQIDRHVQMPPAHPVTPAAAHPRMPAATAVQSAQALDVNRDELARCERPEVPEAASRLGKQMGQAVRTVAPQDAMHRTDRDAQPGTDSVRTPALREPPARRLEVRRVAEHGIDGEAGRLRDRVDR